MTPSDTSAAARPGARVLRLAVLAGLLAALPGCVESLPHTSLPPLGKDAKPTLTADQQKAAAAEQAAKRSAKREEALREIEAKR